MSNETAVSIIIPFYNEKECIGALLNTIEDYYKARKFDFEILFVDDGSVDGTSEMIKVHKPLSFPCKVITLSKNYGAHAAVRAGFMNTTGKYITCLPADLQISFDTVEKLYATALEGYEVINGVREINDIGLFEKTFSRFYASLMRRYVNKDFPYKGLETFMIGQKALKILNSQVEANSSLILQILSLGFKKKFIDIEKTSRKAGKTKWTLSKKIKLMIDSFVAFSFFPIRLVSVIGIIFFIVGLGLSSFLIIRKLVFNDLVHGWPALFSTLLMGFGLTNISLGIIAEYLWRTLDASRKRPVFIVDEITEINH